MVARIAISICVLVGFVACQGRLTIRNVAPRIKSVGPVEVNGTVATIHFELQDHEGDPVDLSLVYVDNTGQQHELKPADGGHGLNGLSASVTGRKHIFNWDLDGVNLTGVKLRMVAIDRAGDGATVETKSFDTTTGLAEIQTFAYTAPK